MYRFLTASVKSKNWSLPNLSSWFTMWFSITSNCTEVHNASISTRDLTFAKFCSLGGHPFTVLEYCEPTISTFLNWEFPVYFYRTSKLEETHRSSEKQDPTSTSESLGSEVLDPHQSYLWRSLSSWALVVVGAFVQLVVSFGQRPGQTLRHGSEGLKAHIIVRMVFENHTLTCAPVENHT